MKKVRCSLPKSCFVSIVLFSAMIMTQLVGCTLKIDQDSLVMTGEIRINSEQMAMSIQCRGVGVIVDVNKPAGEQKNLLSIMQIDSYTIRCERVDDGTEVLFAERYPIALTQEDEETLTELYKAPAEEELEQTPEFMREFVERIQKVFILVVMAHKFDYYIHQAFTSPDVEFKREVILFLGEILEEPKVKFSAVVPSVGGFIGHIEPKKPLRERLIQELNALANDGVLGEEAQKVLERIESGKI